MNNDGSILISILKMNVQREDSYLARLIHNIDTYKP